MKSAHSFSEKVNMLDIPIDNLSLEQALDKAEEIIENRVPQYYGCINLNQILLYKENSRIKKILDSAGLLTADGKSVIWLSKLLHDPLKEKLSGPDFMIELCKMAGQKGYRIFLLGGAPGAAEEAAKNLQKLSPALAVAGTYSPPFGFEKDVKELSKINDMLRKSGADILFVGLGSPKQDIFIDDNKDIYQIPLSCSIGIAIDFISGRLRRAPKWISNIGLEWFWRFCQEPRRLFHRYFVDSWRIVRYYRAFKKEKTG